MGGYLEKPIEVKGKGRFLSLEETIASFIQPLRFYAIFVVLINLMVLAFGIWVNSKSEKLVEYSQMETCYYGMKSIINNNPNEALLNKTVISDLEDLKFTVKEVHLIKVINSFSCDVFVKDLKGVKRYQIVLEKNSSFTHLYKILDVKGMKITSRYQI